MKLNRGKQRMKIGASEKTLIFWLAMLILMVMICSDCTRAHDPRDHTDPALVHPLAFANWELNGYILLPDSSKWIPVSPNQCFLDPLGIRYIMAHWNFDSLSYIPDSIRTLLVGRVAVITDPLYWGSMSMKLPDSVFVWNNQGEKPEPIMLGDTVIVDITITNRRWMGKIWFLKGQPMLRKVRWDE